MAGVLNAFNAMSTIHLHGCRKLTSRPWERLASRRCKQPHTCKPRLVAQQVDAYGSTRHYNDACVVRGSIARIVSASAASVASSERLGEAVDQPFCTLTAGKTDDELALLAREWGYEQVGRPFPSNVTADTIARQLPEDSDQINPLLFAFAVAKGVAVYSACVWASYMLPSSVVSWLAPALWVIMGTAFTGLFAVASDCAHYVGLPITWLSEVFGAAVMSAALYPYVTWRLHYTGHLLRPCTLDYDIRTWRPVTTTEAAKLSGWAGLITKLALSTPLKFIASLGHWLSCWDGLDLKTYHPNNRAPVLAGWIPPALFAGFVLPELIAQLGFAGLCHVWLMPLLVFHFWLSMLSLVAHTGPHIPWRRYGERWDEGQVVVNGTVTLKLPRWVEWLLNDVNYRLPAQMSLAVPCYRLREAHTALEGVLGPYLTLASPNWRLLKNLIYKWQVYDEAAETYTKLGEPLLTQEQVQQLQDGLDKVLPREQQEALRQRTAAAQQQAQDALTRAMPREQQERMQAASAAAASSAGSQLSAAMQALQGVLGQQKPKA